MISKVLSSAVRLWLRSRVEAVENLELEIDAGDRQILSGKIHQVSLYTHKAIYQGLHLSQVQLEARSISVNLPQVLRGKALRLLEAFPVSGQIQLQAADLKASLDSPLLTLALTDLFQQLLAAGGISDPVRRLQDWQIQFSQLTLETDALAIAGTLIDPQGEVGAIALKTGVQLVNPQQLRLYPLELQVPAEFSLQPLEAFELALGTDVALEFVTLTSDALVCCGQIQVNP
uniref:DUF2993 domain-containing protein n=2 Tax=Desertifilaceae TaxID=1969992 RepID=A0A1E5QH68_9CYAN|nr:MULTISPECIES: DUF2993 domain-containing protein [unclassified Desertifilum]OEJ73937.1 hypothetical protein BH720_17740 [Desertifilum tharense IPPAS B-1220]